MKRILAFITIISGAIGLVLLKPFDIYAYTVKVVFTEGFSTSFQTAQPWEDLDEEDVKTCIIAKMTEHFSDRGISVSTSSGDVAVNIGVSGPSNSLGSAGSGGGIGSFQDENPYVDVYSNNFALLSEWQDTLATVDRVSTGIAGTASHEAGHSFNLYHAYMFDTFDPTIFGALNANYQPKEPDNLPSVAKADTAKHWHIMATNNDYISLEQRATLDRFFGINSVQVLDFATSGGTNVTISTAWGLPSRTFEQQQNFTISSGKTLIISSGSYTHDLNGYGITKVGTLQVQGTVTPSLATSIDRLSSGVRTMHGTVQQAINAGSSGDVVLLKAGTFSTEPSMKSGVSLKKDGSGTVIVWGADFDNVSNIDVEGIRFPYPVTLYSGSNIDFTDCEFQAPYYAYDYSVSVTNTHPVFFNGCDFWASKDGLILNNADPFIDQCHFHGNSRYGINATNGSEPDVETANHFYENWNHDIRADSDCDDIWATNNYWNPVPPYVDHENGSAQIHVDDWQAHKPAVLAGSQGLRRQARALLREGELREALEAYRELVSEYPHSHDAFLALGHIASAYTQLGEEAEGIRYLEGVVRSRLDGALEARALFHTIPLLVSAGRLGEAAARADAVVARYPDTATERHALLNQGFILRAQGDAAGGRAVFEALLARHPGSAEASVAGRFVQAGVSEVAEVAEKEDAGIESGLVLWRNFPNPFNPSTTLAFGLSEAAVVDVVIYNALGQEVRRLLSGVSMSAGPHQVAWDGRDGQGREVSSGVYLYRIQAGHFEGVQRMVMVK